MLQFCILIITVCFYMIPFLCFLPTKPTRRQKAGLFFILFFTLCLMKYIFGQAGVLLLLISASAYIAFWNKDRFRNVCVFFVNYLFLVLWDNLFSLFWNAWISDIRVLSQNSIYLFIYHLCSTVLLYCACHTVRYFLRHSPLSQRLLGLSEKFWILITANLLICIAIFVFNIIAGEQIGYAPQTIAFNCILFGIYFAISSILIVRLIKSYLTETTLKHKQESYEQLHEYTSQIENMYSSIRSFKHDYANIMLSLSGYIEQNDMIGLSHYYYNHIFPLSNEVLGNNYRLNQLINIKIMEIKSLVSAKLTYAHELGINVNIEVFNPITSIPMDTLDLTRILGIFLDNAIEAALETSEPKVSFAMFKDEITTIIISNNFVDHDLAIATLHKANVSSKGANRGIGLNNAFKILSEYSNVFLDTQIKDDNFIQHLTIQ